MTQIAKIQQEITEQLSDKATFNALLTTTFKGLNPKVMNRAIMEGMMRGFTFEDFLQKNVYAVPFSNTYSLITSIDYARKIGAKSGVVGKSRPEFEESDGKIISCTVTVQKKSNGHIGDFTETVYFDEYNTGRNLWKSKPRTMIAKVAEMHALRMACPEELSQAYVEEEYAQEAVIHEGIDETMKAEIDAIETVDELKAYYEKNKGRGKEFDRYVMNRKHELQSA